MNNTYSRLEDLNRRLKNNLTLTYDELENIYAAFRNIIDELAAIDHYRENHSHFTVDINGIERNIRKMYARGSILKKDVAFLLARNTMIQNTAALLDLIHYQYLNKPAVFAMQQPAQIGLQ
jgi:hypothetical protein